MRCKKSGQSPAHPASPGVCKIARGAGSGKKPPPRGLIPTYPKTVCSVKFHIFQCLTETYTKYAIYRLRTFTTCLLSRYPHTLLYDSILHGIIGQQTHPGKNMLTADYPSHSTFQAHLKKYTPQAYRSVCCPHDSVIVCFPAKCSKRSTTDWGLYYATRH